MFASFLSAALRDTSCLTLQGRQLVQDDGHGEDGNEREASDEDKYANICPISGHFHPCDYISCSDNSDYHNGFFSNAELGTSTQHSRSLTAANCLRPLAPALISVFTESY